MLANRSGFESSVFINCPFDIEYQPLFRAIVYTLLECAMRPRCALETHDSGQSRREKIETLIAASRFGIHDLSRVELDGAHQLPRFNMPLELGFDLAARRYGRGTLSRKVVLILDSERFRYQKFISDMAGSDPSSHENDPELVVEAVCNWLATHTTRKLPGPVHVWQRFQKFESALPGLAEAAGHRVDKLPFVRLVAIADAYAKSAAIRHRRTKTRQHRSALTSAHHRSS